MLATGPCVDAAVTAVSPVDCYPGKNQYNNDYNNVKCNICKLPSLKD